MNRFAALIDSLVFTPSRNGKMRLLADYFAHTPAPDRGWALAALTGTLVFHEAKPAAIRQLVLSRVDPDLFAWSYDYVGDLAETAALIWPERHPQANSLPPSLSEVVDALHAAKRAEVMGLIEGWMDTLDASARFALLKLITGSLRIGVSARLAKTALAEWGRLNVDDIEECWHGLTPPYQALFAWLEGRAERPDEGLGAGFRPLMLAHPLDEEDMAGLDAAAYCAEWKWDGIRVQLVARGAERRIYSRTGDELSGAFPDLADHMSFDAVLDGELLVVRDGVVAPFNDLQQRLNRKQVTAKTLQEFPAFVRLYDMLFDRAEDLRSLGFLERRARLERWYEEVRPRRMDLSPMVPFAGWDELKALRAGAREAGIEGLMLKRCDSPYTAGRPKGPWFKWKRGALTLDTVLMYAQRGHGKRSSYYSDFTFGAWRGDELVPVGKAYFGFTDAELVELDRWVRNHTTKRFGPVREVAPGLVLEVAFDSVHRSGRHKSGLAMRFPRVHRIRWDKPAHEADRLETLERMVVG
ncbi:cisplatin damage response ATP-dependent DNA ligase [Azospirillum sp. TSO22-1]|uniref:cisplatin damage response ATP-dependent DNA ligase n=1 Tax=Azospirillum sp. TSO22-1 TaxID=716789 RepID=UPI000D6111C8|nr:cisplatin damage response ATP-dependent DNA ligase [Azospirillum sp. TSO22-1]PWC38355.1 ATP-dependent DNA ligase [Azospirillum sp. TSO22-1]